MPRGTISKHPLRGDLIVNGWVQISRKMSAGSFCADTGQISIKGEAAKQANSKYTRKKENTRRF
jgi:hypothetical protein